MNIHHHTVFGIKYTRGNVPLDYILCWDLNGDVLDKSANSLNGTITGSTTYKGGRKPGRKSLNFTDGVISTVSNLPILTDKFTMSFWIKTTQTSLGYLFESSTSYSVNYTFASLLNDISSGGFEIIDTNGGSTLNLGYSPAINDGTWKHVIIKIDRSLGKDQNLIYINNVLAYTQFAPLYNDLTGIFGSFPFFLGYQGTYKFIGSYQDFKMYNRITTRSEDAQLFNE